MKFDIYGFSSNLPDHYKGKAALWGAASTGDPHLGYAIYMLMLKKLQKEGTRSIVLIAEQHAYWDAEKTSLEMIGARANVYHQCFEKTGLLVKKTQEFYKNKKYLTLLFELSEKMNILTLLQVGKLSLTRCEKIPHSDKISSTDELTLADAIRVAIPIIAPVTEIKDLCKKTEYINSLFQISAQISVKKILEAMYSGTVVSHLNEVINEDTNEPTLADAISVATQIIDPLYLGIDILLCGPHESVIHEYGLKLLQQEKGYSTYHVWTTLCPGLTKKEMHASDQQVNKILLSDTKEMIINKLNQYFSEFKDQKIIPPLVLYCQKTLFPLAELSEKVDQLNLAVENLNYDQMQAILLSGIVATIHKAFSHELAFVPDSSIRLALKYSSISLSFPIGYKRNTFIQHPVFVVGSPRSGTTVIAACLMNHPNLQGHPEAESLFLLDLHKIYADLHQGINRRNYKPLQPYIEANELLNSLGTLSDTILQKSYVNTKRYVDHTPWYAGIIPFINALYPDSIFVHITRSGIDVVNSLGVSYQKGFAWAGSNVAERATLWARLVKLALNSKNLVGDARYIQVRYEDFCADPTNTLKNILAKFDLQWNPACLEPITIAHVRPGRGNAAVLGERDKDENIIIKTRSSLASYTTENWSQEDIIEFKHLAKDVMQRLDYTPELRELNSKIQSQLKNKNINIGLSFWNSKKEPTTSNSDVPDFDTFVYK